MPGTLKELIAGGHHRELTRDIWPQIAGYCLERREGEAARRQALAIYKDMVGDWPKAKWETTKPVSPTPEIRQKIRAQQIRHAYRGKGGPIPEPKVRTPPPGWGETRQSARGMGE